MANMMAVANVSELMPQSIHGTWLESSEDKTPQIRHLSPTGQAFITFVYLFGICGNVGALVLLAKGETARNRKQTLMVRCLAWNDLLALLGSFTMMYLQLYLKPSHVLCAFRVLLRAFGLSSACVAIVMAVERWLALTRPFVYQKHVTHYGIKKAIFLLWLAVLFLVCLPFAGFGLYYDKNIPEDRQRCVRYRFASKSGDIAYAYLVFSVGITLCTIIVVCNLAVVRVLCSMGKKSAARMGRTTVHKDSNELSFNESTPEELSFAKLMVILCIFFVTCWVPQMIAILVAQTHRNMTEHVFYNTADGLMALNFTLDPVFYVLSRRPHRKGLRRLLKPFCQSCWRQPERLDSGRSNTQDVSKSTKEVNHNSEPQEALRNYFGMTSMPKYPPLKRALSAPLAFQNFQV